MYIARIHIKNFRCFLDTSIDCKPGLNVIIGENNAGKTTLLRAIALVFERRGRSRPTLHDFHRLVTPLTEPPTITVTVTLRSSENDTPADRALVASWLTVLQDAWEATLTYTFFLPDQHHAEFATAVAGVNRDGFFEVVEEFLPKFVSRIYGGNPATLVVADGESLARFDCQFLDALRDVESEMFAGSTPVFHALLQEILDVGKDDATRRGLRSSFRTKSRDLRTELLARLDTARLFQLAQATGAADSGSPSLQGAVDESDFMAALRLFIAREQFAFPATHNGLGYNNLLYISLILASLSFRASDRRGQNAAIFPMLLIEEPEAHLHPALQYKLLAHIVDRVQAEPNKSRQIFVTTHSTHITAASRLSPIICLSVLNDGSVGVAYPAGVFPDTDEGRESRGYVERYLDATKSAMLFAKATVFVEGITEQLVVPALAKRNGCSLDEHHVCVIRVDGVTFKHFLPLFGGTTDPAGAAHALKRRVACIIDADPSRKERAAARPRFKSCFPFALQRNVATYDYAPVSSTAVNLQTQIAGAPDIRVFHGVKTFEYDFALANHTCKNIVTSAVKESADVASLCVAQAVLPDSLKEFLTAEESADLAALAQDVEKHRFAAIFLCACKDAKGEHAFALEHCIRTLPPEIQVNYPPYIHDALQWVISPRPAPQAAPAGGP
ncbi:MAG: AAA family ATPase [Planctomycetaceae bacterium]|nr:AAA family ATPase [Planctomycetaceae bacterium]